MAYILDAEREDPDSGARYRAYLESVREAFPPGAWALATSDWYFAFGDPRCPHDAWLESVTISEPSTREQSEERTCALRIRLLAASHDGCIELFYPRTFSYTFACADAFQGHGDWRYDEFRVSEGGHLLHEIEWWSPNAQGAGSSRHLMSNIAGCQTPSHTERQRRNNCFVILSETEGALSD